MNLTFPGLPEGGPIGPLPDRHWRCFRLLLVVLAIGTCLVYLVLFARHMANGDLSSWVFKTLRDYCCTPTSSTMEQERNQALGLMFPWNDPDVILFWNKNQSGIYSLVKDRQIHCLPKIHIMITPMTFHDNHQNSPQTGVNAELVHFLLVGGKCQCENPEEEAPTFFFVKKHPARYPPGN